MHVEVRQLDGNWDDGYALAKHVVHSVRHEDTDGNVSWTNTRSDPGEALFQLKYRSDWKQVDPLATAIAQHIVPLFPAIGLIVPMPASTNRARQPVTELAQSGKADEDPGLRRPADRDGRSSGTEAQEHDEPRRACRCA